MENSNKNWLKKFVLLFTVFISFISCDSDKVFKRELENRVENESVSAETVFEGNGYTISIIRYGGHEYIGIFCLGARGTNTLMIHSESCPCKQEKAPGAE